MAHAVGQQPIPNGARPQAVRRAPPGMQRQANPGASQRPDARTVSVDDHLCDPRARADSLTGMLARSVEMRSNHPGALSEVPQRTCGAASQSPVLARKLVKDGKTGEYYDDGDPDQRRFATAGEALEWARLHGGYKALGPSLFHNLPVEIVNFIVALLGLEGMLKLRASNRAGLVLVEQLMLNKGAPGSKAELIMGNPYHFPEQFKTQDVKTPPVRGSLASKGAWLVYAQVASGPAPAYVEVKFPKSGASFPKKDDLFPRTNYKQKQARSALEGSGRLFSPPKIPGVAGGKRTWTAQINDAWILGVIHQGLAVRYLADLTQDNLWDRSHNRPTALGRELVQLYHAGYRPAASGTQATRDDPHAHRGMLLVPTVKPTATPRLSDALRDQLTIAKWFFAEGAKVWKPY